MFDCYQYLVVLFPNQHHPDTSRILAFLELILQPFSAPCTKKLLVQKPVNAVILKPFAKTGQMNFVRTAVKTVETCSVGKTALPKPEKLGRKNWCSAL